MQQHRSIDVGDATLDCTLCGSGAPVVLLANVGCGTGYFDHLGHALVTGGGGNAINRLHAIALFLTLKRRFDDTRV